MTLCYDVRPDDCFITKRIWGVKYFSSLCIKVTSVTGVKVKHIKWYYWVTLPYSMGSGLMLPTRCH